MQQSRAAYRNGFIDELGNPDFRVFQSSDQMAGAAIAKRLRRLEWMEMRHPIKSADTTVELVSAYQTSPRLPAGCRGAAFDGNRGDCVPLQHVTLCLSLTAEIVCVCQTCPSFPIVGGEFTIIKRQNN